MTRAHSVSLRMVAPKCVDRRLRLWRPIRTVRLCTARHVLRSFPIRLPVVNSLGQDVDYDQGLEWRSFVEPMTFALVEANLNILAEEEELKPLPRNVENLADDPSLQNPLERLERMGTGWFGVILDFEGVVVQGEYDSHVKAWLKLAEEENRPFPLQSSLKRAAAMKAEQAISEVLCWGRDPAHVRRLALRKEEIFTELTKDTPRTARDGLYRLLETLKQHGIPIAICSSERSLVYDCVKSLDLCQYVDEVISAEDVFRCAPDPEAYAFAAQKLNRPTFRCVVVGASNHSCEAAHDCGMKCIAAAGTQPLYELNAADLVIKQLDKISFMNLKQLFRQEEFGSPEDEANSEVDAALW